MGLEGTTIVRPDSGPVRRQPPPDVAAIAAIGAVLAFAVVTRQAFIGDGIRHVVTALESDHAPVGEVRWLLFPPITWAVVHPLARAGWIDGVEQALRPLAAVSALAGVAYLFALRAWLAALGYDARTRASAILLAGATAPFLLLYSDIAEPCVAGAVAVAALAFGAAIRRRRALRAIEVAAIVAAIVAASLVYQALVLALAFLPLVLDGASARRTSTWLTTAAIVVAALCVVVALRTRAGDSAAFALQSLANGGERNPLARDFFGSGSPAKWVVAAFAGPAQAFIALRDFSGLPALASALTGARPSAVVNAVWLLLDVALLAAVVRAIAVRRDWRLALALAAVVALPVARNNQYAYVKFYALWPIVVALAATAFAPRRVLIAAVGLLAINGGLLASDIAGGRSMHAEVTSLYSSVPRDACFFTSGWGAPFQYLWARHTVAVIAVLTMGPDPREQDRALTNAVESCFCEAPVVWTDTPSETAPTVRFIADRFEYRSLDLATLLPAADERTAIAASPMAIFAYTPARANAACSQIRSRATGTATAR